MAQPGASRLSLNDSGASVVKSKATTKLQKIHDTTRVLQYSIAPLLQCPQGKLIMARLFSSVNIGRFNIGNASKRSGTEYVCQHGILCLEPEQRQVEAAILVGCVDGAQGFDWIVGLIFRNLVADTFGKEVQTL